MGNGGFDGKLFAVRSDACYCAELPHPSARHTRLPKSLHVATVRLMETIRNELVQQLTNGVLRGALKHALRRIIEDNNLLLMIHTNDRIHRGFDDAFESELADEVLLLCSLSAGHRPHDSGLGVGP